MSKKPNKKMIKRVIEQIKSRPEENFDMGNWLGTPTDDRFVEGQLVSDDGEILFCKTALCVGGATLAISGKKNDINILADVSYPPREWGYSALGPIPQFLREYRVKKYGKEWPDSTGEANELLEHTAAKRLGISKKMAARLFHVDDWPETLIDSMYDGNISERDAAVLLLKEIAKGKNPWKGDQSRWSL